MEVGMPPATATVPVSEHDDPQIVIERLAQKRVSEEDAGKYFTAKLSNIQRRTVSGLFVDLLRQLVHKRP